MAFYVLSGAEAPWGDYGHVLAHGMTAHLGRTGTGLLQLERTGPFVPPISFPGPTDIVVTDEFRRLLGSSGLTGLTYRPVVKARIVLLEWERWDATEEEPEEYPPEGEPEGYILSRPHLSQLADTMPELWELCLDEHAASVREGSGWGAPIYIVASSWDGTDFFRAKGVGYSYVSDRARQWLEQASGRWMVFRQAPTE